MPPLLNIQLHICFILDLGSLLHQHVSGLLHTLGGSNNLYLLVAILRYLDVHARLRFDFVNVGAALPDQMLVDLTVDLHHRPIVRLDLRRRRVFCRTKLIP